MRALVSLISGSIFGLGLVIADMTNPARVQAFLDIAGNWDPTLAFVMGGAMIPMLIAWRIGGQMPSISAALPALKTEIDSRLIAGSAMFGAGWGLGGFCPGPAIAALSFGGVSAITFCVAMLVGMAAHSLSVGRLKPA